MSRDNYLIALLILATVAILYFAYPFETNFITQERSLGTVLKVSNCDSGRHRLNCDIQTNTHQWNTDLTDWPGDIIQAGDVLSIRTDVGKNRRNSWFCKNGACRQDTSCLSWMPCWRDKY